MAAQIKSLRLVNWRNFKKVELLIGGRLFVVGPNGSGKTNLIDALRFLQDISRPKGGLQVALDDRQGLSHVRSLHARGSPNLDIEVTVEIEGEVWCYSLSLSGTKSTPFRIEKELVKRGETTLLERPTPEDKKDNALRQQTHLEQQSQNSNFRVLKEMLTAITFVHVVPQIAKKASLQGDAVALREAPGSDFIQQLAALEERKQNQLLRQIEKVLKIAVPKFKKLRVTRDKRTGAPHLEANYSHWRPQGGWQNEVEFSDGTLRLIGLFWAIYSGQGILVLEEPELSLHSEIVNKLPQILVKAARQNGRQIIVSTHSTSVLDDEGIDPSEIAILSATNDATGVTLASDDKELVEETKAGLPLGASVAARARPVNIDQLVFQL
jgi:predicted ATPase